MGTMRFLAVFACVLLSLLGTGYAFDQEELAEEFSDHFLAYHLTGIKTKFLADTLEKYALPDELRFTNWQNNGRFGPRKSILTCSLCTLGVNTILNAHAAGNTTEEIGQILINLCESLNLSTNRVCEGTVIANLDVMEYVLDNSEITTPRMCSMLMQADECGRDDPSLEWTVDLGSTPKPSKEAGAKEEVRANPFSVAHITDIHFDPNYLVGGNAECGEPMCCRSDQGIPEFPNATAGRWGDYRVCDIPWEVVVDGVTHIADNHQVDYVYMTGDLVDHGVWDTSFTHNNVTLKRVMDQLKATFGDIPVFPCTGNHEPHPLNVFAPVTITDPAISTAWLYETLADLWGQWLPAETRETILRGGFYTVLVRPGFRVVALNNMQCYVYNWFLYNNHNDPDGQLAWLITVLQDAETAGEKVHLLYHIPPGSSDCYRIFSREFHRIVDRFESTITGQFSGHTHNDEFHVFYAKDEPTRANNIVYTAGSLTSYANKNPNYRIYTVDGDDLTIQDHETWYYNLTEANLSPDTTPNWVKLYSFKEAYGVASMEPTEIDRVVQTMATDTVLMQQYFRYYYLNGDPKLEEGCDADCEDRLLCGIVTAEWGDSTQCDLILSALRRSRNEIEDLN